MLKITIILFFSFVSINCLDLCGDWIPFKDQKCFKVLPKKTTQDEAYQKCREISSDSTLVTIKDQEEQEFINQFLVQFNNISMGAWNGLKYYTNYRSYRWPDNKDPTYNNWSEDAIREGSEPCVQMSLMNRTLGKWTDSHCRRRALIVCQRKQIFTLNSARHVIENMIKTIENQKLDFNTKIEELENKINSLTENIENKIKPTNELKYENNELIKEEKPVSNSCGLNEFDCGDGDCVGNQLVCNDEIDCDTGADEKDCKKMNPINVGFASHSK